MSYISQTDLSGSEIIAREKADRRAALQRQINQAHAAIAETARAHAEAVAAAEAADKRLGEAIRIFHLLRGALQELEAN